MTSKWGTFSEPGYLHPGHIYRKGYKEPPSKLTGVNFKVGTGKEGKTNDATFSKFESIHAGDRYEDAQTRLAAKAKAKLNSKEVSSAPFKAASPMKKATGAQAGSYYGTLGGKIPYEPNPEHKHTKDTIKHEGRQILTSPAKRGTYGFNKTTLSERKGPKGVMGEYQYYADPYDKRDAAKGIRVQKKAEGVSSQPFRPASGGRVGATFNRIEYMPRGPDSVRRGAKQEGPPFRPPRSAPHSLGTLGTPFEYMPTPDVKLSGESRRTNWEAWMKEAKSWRPNFDHRHASDPFDLPGVLYPDNVSLEPVQGLPASQQSRLRGPPEQVDVRSLLATLARQQQQQQLMLQSQQGPPYPVAGNSWSLDTQPAAVQVNAEATYSLPMQGSAGAENTMEGRGGGAAEGPSTEDTARQVRRRKRRHKEHKRTKSELKKIRSALAGLQEQMQATMAWQSKALNMPFLAERRLLLQESSTEGLMEARELAGLSMPGMPGLAQGIPSVIHLSVVGVEGQDVEAQQLVCMNFDQARRLWKMFVNRAAQLLAESDEECEASQPPWQETELLMQELGVWIYLLSQANIPLMTALLSQNLESKSTGGRPWASGSDLRRALLEVLDLKQWQQERLAEMRDVCRERLAPLLRRQRQLLATLQSVAAEQAADAPEASDGASWGHMNQVSCCKELQECAHRLASTRKKFETEFWHDVLTPRQGAQALVCSFPWACDALGLCDFLAELRGHAAPEAFLQSEQPAREQA